MNKVSGPTQEIYDLVNSVRERSFMAPMPPAVLTDANLMQEYIQRERRVELFYENWRYWATRLYMESDDPIELAKEKNYIGPESWPYAKSQRCSHGMKPVEDPNGKIEVDGKRYKMKRIAVNDGRVFYSPRSYFWPIMQDELSRTPTLIQNPGW